MGTPVTDEGLAWFGGNTCAAASAAAQLCSAAQIAAGAAGGGYIVVTNLDPSVTIYLGKDNTVTTSGANVGEALPAGASRTWRSANLANEWAIGSNSINVSVRR